MMRTPAEPRTEEMLLAEQVRLVLGRTGADGWVEHDDGFWFGVTPPGYRPRRQGWKLHVTATPLSAPLVALRAAEILVAAGCAFKVARGLDQVAELVSPTCRRGAGGKVVTVYPRDDEQFVALAERLHRATLHLPGPAILSDRAYRPGSNVHYRYGVFAAPSELGNDGSYRSPRLQAPDGSFVPDERNAWFSPPEWAPCPLPQEPATQAGTPVLLDGRFLVREAIRYRNKGGVYIASDQVTGDDVVIKQARPHTGAMLDGSDTRDSLRHEAALLDRLAPRGVTPRRVSLFDHDGHLFLVQERVAGTSLLAWVHQRLATADGNEQAAISLDDVLPVARGLLAATAAAHAEGLVIRDLSPSNVIIGPDGAITLVDLEYAAEPGRPALVAGTPGFAAPEQVRPGGLAAAPDLTADLYSLGALLFFLSSGVSPALPSGSPLATPGEQRLGRLVRLVAASNPTTRTLGPAILALLADDPGRRWSLDRVGAFLDMAGRDPTRVVRLLPEHDRISRSVTDELLRDGLAHLVATMRPPTGDRLWPVSRADARTDPRNVQFGAAGPLGVLTRAAAATGAPELTAAVHTAAAWLDSRLATGDRLLPGLHFGASGALWALHDAAHHLDDPALARRALERAKEIAVRWPNPDVCHGAAGAGMAQLHLWLASGDDTFGPRVRQCADGLLSAAAHRDGLLVWPIPADFDSALAGLTHFGFAHGVAGIGTFLLAAGQATGDDRYLGAADAAGATLRSLAERVGPAAWWPTGEETDPTRTSRMAHWCSGSSGIGTFLIRLWQHGRRTADRELAEAAACAVRDARWRMTTASCHGLAGNGEFLLDLAEITGEPRYRDWARELAACIDARAVQRAGRRVVLDESGGPGVGYGTGLSGALSFLWRLRHGGARPWMADDAARPAVPARHEAHR